MVFIQLVIGSPLGLFEMVHLHLNLKMLILIVSQKQAINWNADDNDDDVDVANKFYIYHFFPSPRKILKFYYLYILLGQTYAAEFRSSRLDDNDTTALCPSG